MECSRLFVIIATINLYYFVVIGLSLDTRINAVRNRLLIVRLVRLALVVPDSTSKKKLPMRFDDALCACRLYGRNREDLHHQA